MGKALDETIKRMQDKWKNSPVLNSPEVPFLNITISEYTKSKFDEWLKEAYARAVVKQKAEWKDPDSFVTAMWEAGYPYHGAIGGEIEYRISPNGLGYVIKAHYAYIDETFDLTEYDTW